MDKGLTPERHKELGAELFCLRENLLRLIGELITCYGSKKNLVNYTAKAMSQIDNLRYGLDEMLYRENPKEFKKTTYYPGGGTK